MNISAHIMTRDGLFIEPCLRSVMPFVKQIIIAIDSRSNQFYELKIKMICPQAEVFQFEVNNPLVDLVTAQNKMLEMTKADWVWPIGDDEIYYEKSMELIEKSLMGNVVALKAWAPWNMHEAHKATSKMYIAKFFRNDNLRYEGKFGKEKLCKNGIPVFDGKEYTKINTRFIHLTHLKFQTWREEMNMQRNVDGRSLIPMPDSVVYKLKKIINKYGYQNLSFVRGQ